jgi:serine/threonine protein kinase
LTLQKLNDYFSYSLGSESNLLTNYLLVMEYADGGALKDYLKIKNDLTWDDRLNMGFQLACAVLCLHNEGIVHRDLVNFFLLYLNYFIIHTYLFT